MRFLPTLLTLLSSLHCQLSMGLEKAAPGPMRVATVHADTTSSHCPLPTQCVFCQSPSAHINSFWAVLGLINAPFGISPCRHYSLSLPTAITPCVIADKLLQHRVIRTSGQLHLTMFESSVCGPLAENVIFPRQSSPFVFIFSAW